MKPDGQNSVTVEPQFNEVAGNWPNLFVKWRVRYTETLYVTNLRGKDQNVRYIEVIVNRLLLLICSALIFCRVLTLKIVISR